MIRLYTLILLAFFASNSLRAQLVIPALNSAQTIDFTGYTGAGFSPTPAAGQLDSDTWSVLGLSDGDVLFGDTDTTAGTDFRRGTNAGTTTTGGIWAFIVNATDTIMGAQPTGTDFNPGHFILRIENQTGGLISDLSISYDIFVRNAAGRASSFNFSYSNDTAAASFIPVASLDFTTPEAADASPAWTSTNKMITLNDVNIPDGNFFYLRWSSADVSGTGSRDKVGLDNITVIGSVAPIVAAFTADSVCFGDTTTFTNNSFTTNGTIVSYAWDFGDGATSTITNPTHLFQTADTFNVKLVVTNSIGEKDSVIVPVITFELPEFSFFASNPEGCAPLCSFFNIIHQNSAVFSEFYWDLGNGITDTNETTATVCYGPGMYNLSLTTVSDKGCVFSDTLQNSIIAYETPVSDFTFTTSDTLSATFTPNITGGSTPYTFTYDYGDGTSGSDSVHTYALPDSYEVCLMVTDDNGCSDTTCKFVDIIMVDVSKIQANKSLEIHPNPSSNGIFILNQTLKGELNIYNVLGECVLRKQLTVSNSKETLDLSAYPAGSYYLSLQNGSEVISKRLIITK